MNDFSLTAERHERKHIAFQLQQYPNIEAEQLQMLLMAYADTFEVHTQPDVDTVLAALQEDDLGLILGPMEIVRAWHFNRVRNTTAYQVVLMLDGRLPTAANLPHAIRQRLAQLGTPSPTICEDIDEEWMRQLQLKWVETLPEVTLQEAVDIWLTCHQFGILPVYAGDTHIMH